MNIGVVYLSAYPPQKGASGADRRVRNIARGLSNEGHTVHMLVPYRQESNSSPNHTDGYEIHYLAKCKMNSFQVARRIRFWQEVCIFALSHQLHWLLLYSTTIDSLFPAIYLKHNGVHIAAEYCDLRSSGFSLAKPKEILRYCFFKLDEYFLPKVTDLNIVISNYLNAWVKRVAPHVATMQLPVLVDSDQFVSNEIAATQFRRQWGLDDALVIAYVGGLWFPEGVKYLVEAFALMVRSNPYVKLVIAGSLDKSPRHDDIVSQIAQLGMQSQIVTTGWIDTSEVVALLSAADILALPQTNHTFSIAALPTKLAEYSAMGKAIAATRVGDVPIYFHHMENVILCEPENAESLAEALSLLVKQPTLRKELGNAAKKTAYNTFDFRSAGKKISGKMRGLNSASNCSIGE